MELRSEILDLELCMVAEEFRFLDDIRRTATQRVAALEEELRRLKG